MKDLLIFLLAFPLFYSTGFAQSPLIVGKTSGDSINYFSSVNFVAPHPANWTSESKEYDLNHDGLNDLRWSSYVGVGTSSMDSDVSLTSINGAEVALFKDTTLLGMQPFLLGDTIKAVLPWIVGGPYHSFAGNHWNIGFDSLCIADTLNCKTDSAFMLVRIPVGGTWNYGWVRFSAQANFTFANCKVFEYAILGDTITVDRDRARQEGRIEIYPNPTSTTLRLVWDGDANLNLSYQVLDVQGRILLSGNDFRNGIECCRTSARDLFLKSSHKRGHFHFEEMD